MDIETTAHVAGNLSADTDKWADQLTQLDRTTTNHFISKSVIKQIL